MPIILPKCPKNLKLNKKTCRCTKNLKKGTKKKALRTIKNYKLKKKNKKKDKHKMSTATKNQKMKYNSQFIEVFEKLKKIRTQQGKHRNARAYEKARDAIILLDRDIYSIDDVKGVKGIGKSSILKLEEFIKTGTLKTFEDAKTNPVFIFTEIYGVGPKKAEELVEKYKITSISQLRKKQDELLNDKQKIGLKYYEDVLKRIPRKEIDLYNKKLTKIFDSVKNKDSTFEIVGSYRRGVSNSGDIDIIISDPTDSREVFNKFLDKLIEKKILIEVLSRGDVKSMGISKMPRKPARRIDFMFTPKKEHAFAILYFTGSKAFNTGMRAKALKMGYSMNEHGMYKMVNGKKGSILNKNFKNEQDIFKFLKLKYREPTERKQVYDAIDIVVLKKKNKSLKKKTEKKAPFSVENLESYTENQLSNFIRKANKGYYNNNKPVMSDAEYDMLKEYIEDKYPNNQSIYEGHSGVNVTKNKIELPVEMWSMDKEKTIKGIQKKLKRHSGDFVVSAKVDGISVLYVNQNFLATRGNGKIGQDISYMIPHLKLPKQDGIFRGELLIKKKTFEKKYSKRFANARNFISGIANSKTMDSKIIKDLDVVLYEVIEPELKASEQMKFLSNTLKYKNTVKNQIYKNKELNNDILSKLLIDWRENYDWEIDGLIVCEDRIVPRISGNPKHAFAFKMVLSDQIVEARVKKIIWTPSKDGFVKPRIQIEPVKIGGATIMFATAHNASFVYKENIGPGAIIQMIRSGDVIPKVHKVIAPASKPQGPPETMKVKWNKTKVDLILEDIKGNEIVQLKIIAVFFEKIGVAGLGKGNIKRIYDAGFDNIQKIIAMKKEDFLTVEGFKDKMATKVYNSIRTRLELVDLHELMAATNIFGRGMGNRKIKKILDVYPNILLEEESNNEKTEKIAELPGFQIKTAKTFVPHIKKFLKFLDEAKLRNKLKKKRKLSKKMIGHPLYGKKIVMTGFRDIEIQDMLKEIGIELASAVTSKTDMVLIKNNSADTSKVDKARKLDIKLITKEDFIKKYKI